MDKGTEDDKDGDGEFGLGEGVGICSGIAISGGTIVEEEGVAGRGDHGLFGALDL